MATLTRLSSVPLNAVARPFKPLTALIAYIGELTILLGETLYWMFVPPFSWERFLAQARRVGMGSFTLASLISFFVGVIIALQMAYLMIQLGAEIYIPNVVAISLTRELAPVLTSLVVAGRVGAGITAEIGTMHVTEQISALRVFAVNPVKYLVVPRFLALLIMLPLLTVFADLIGIFGGFVICVVKLGINGHTFLSMVLEALLVRDVVTGLIKTVFFALIIVLVGCHQGMNIRGGADGVGRAVTVSVVTSFILIILADSGFTAMFYFLFQS